MTLNPSLTTAWEALSRHAAEERAIHVRDLLDDPKRFAQFSCEAQGMLLDYTRQRLDARALELLHDLAANADLSERIEALLRGDTVNNTERRPALHTALRRDAKRPLVVGGRDLMRDVAAERAKLDAFVRGVHSGAIGGSTAQPFRTIVNIGIGGSDLGPVMAVEALACFRRDLEVRFVSNIDGCQIADVVASCDPARTLFVICSKTFTTLETMTNARIAREWIAERLGSAALSKHFAAVSTNHKAMDEFGVNPDYRFTMWDWVGGRYSIWSSIGLALALAVGTEHFKAFLDGGAAIDEHFASAPFAQNLPVLLGLLGAWNVNFLGTPSHAVLPYDQRLHRFPAYLQQLEMESNGKRVHRDGKPVDHATGPVLWGEPGSNAQHSFFQLLHQGTADVAMDFIAPVRASNPYQEQQNLALANCFAQAEAFARGQTEAQVRSELAAKGVASAELEALVPHKVHPGNRACSVLLFQRLDPNTLGKLIALYEHKVYVQSVLWDINPFDQWGVELGKKLADKLAPAVRDPGAAGSQPPGVRGLLEYVKRWR
ncbi:MAG TPA: glucose-6-phosphate isomerase [Steroidobacteraceae bacterium]|nr:glucose-6-phosphate isomerase [Steroidobacteraceae bacterium]